MNQSLSFGINVPAPVAPQRTLKQRLLLPFLLVAAFGCASLNAPKAEASCVGCSYSACAEQVRVDYIEELENVVIGCAIAAGAAGVVTVPVAEVTAPAVGATCLSGGTATASAHAAWNLGQCYFGCPCP